MATQLPLLIQINWAHRSVKLKYLKIVQHQTSNKCNRNESTALRRSEIIASGGGIKPVLLVSNLHPHLPPRYLFGQLEQTIHITLNNFFFLFSFFYSSQNITESKVGNFKEGDIAGTLHYKMTNETATKCHLGMTSDNYLGFKPVLLVHNIHPIFRPVLYNFVGCSARLGVS